MTEIENGLFAIEEKMPCNPRDIVVGRYSLDGTLQRMEREEAAARIISFSQQLDCWVGVSSSRIIKMVNDEYREKMAFEAVQEHNRREERRVQVAMQNYIILCVLTLGFGSLFVDKPSAELKKAPEFDPPFTGGPEHFITGIRDLIRLDMLKYLKEGHIFVPTPLLITTIMEKQGLATTV